MANTNSNAQVAEIKAATSLSDLYALLESHDWHHVYASGDAYYRGDAEWKRLCEIAKESDDHKALFDAYNAYMGGRGEKPVCPTETEDKPAETLKTPETQTDTQPETTAEIPVALNWRNLVNLVSDGSIFYVEFIKRTTGELRKMRCRTGVKKHLRGGSKGYSAKAKNLLTVFDMQAKGYRSIPVEAIQSLSVNGQTFSFAGV